MIPAEMVMLPWIRHAACRHSDPEIFYPTPGGTCVPAQRVCQSCPVKDECLTHALTVGERWGVWGGVNMEALVRGKQSAASQRRRAG